jgi:hypothetical protein
MTKYFYAVLALTLLLVTGSIVSQYSDVNRPVLDEFYKNIQPISADEALDARSVIIRAAENPTAPAEYYSLLDKAEVLKWRVQKTLYHDRYTDVSAAAKLQSVLESTGGANNVINRAQQNFREKFGMDAMLKAGAPWQATHAVRTEPHAPVGPYAWRWYLISLMLALTFCLMRAHENGLAVWIELLQPSHLALAVIAWPVFA